MAKYLVCPECGGEGKHLNNAFRNEVLEPELAADPEFLEEMQIGVYDVICSCCKGLRVVTEEQQAAWKADAQWRAEIRYESLMLGER